jgi:hypothetical protein
LILSHRTRQDVYFKLTGYARELTGKFNGTLAGLIYTGYLTSQMVAFGACATTGAT